jgi:cytoskeletal protein RodZ
MSDRSDLGNILRTTRESLGWSVEDIAHRTRIPQAILHQLENNDYSTFPSLAYAKSFLGRYCDYLDIDAIECLAHFATGEARVNPDPHDSLADHEEARSPVMEDARNRENKVPGKKQEEKWNLPAAIRQPLAVFSFTCLLVTCAIFAFMKISNSLEEEPVTGQEPAETLGSIGGVATQAPAGPDLSNVPRALLVNPEGEAPLVVGDPLGSADIQALSASPSFQADVGTEFSLDTPPPRAVIIEE